MSAARTVAIPAGDGQTFDGWLYAAPQGRAPGLVMIPEIFGANAPLREIAAGFAAQGFTVLLVDAFWRLERHVALDYDKAGGEKARGLHGVYDYDQGVRDMLAALACLRTQPECNGRAAISGYCFGGTLAYLAAARGQGAAAPDAAVSYYATRIQHYLEEGPKVHRPLLLHIGELDHTTPPEAVEKILAAVKGNVQVTSHVYAGAKHGFCNPRLPSFDAAATATANERTFAFLRAHLK